MRAKFSDIIKNTAAYQQIKNDIDNNFNHAYLFVSADRDALDLLIEEVCLAVYCKDGGCRNCPECARVIKGSKPDIKEPNPIGGAIKVEDINEIVSDTYLTAFEKGKKLYIIRDMESISERAQNKLLKTLEEPNENVHFIITTASPQGILPTVVSRVKQINLGAFATEDIKKGLIYKGYEEEKSLSIAKCSGGSITTAFKLASEEVYFDKVDEILNIFCMLNKSEDVVKYIQNPILSDNLSEAIDIIEIVFHDLLLINNGVGQITFNGREEKLKTISQKYNTASIAAAIDAIYNARKKIRANCNKTNIIDSLFLSILEVRNRCK